MKKLIITVCIIIIAGVAVFISLFSGTVGNNDDATPESMADNQTAPDQLSIDVFGIIKAKETRNIVIDFPAYVEKVFVRDGERVRQGISLVKLNTLEYATLIRNQENELENTQNLLNQELQQLANREELWRTGSISRYDLDEFRKIVDARRINLLNLKSSLRVMKEKLNRPYIKNNEIITDLKNAVVYNINCTSGDKLGEPDPVCILSILDLDSLVVMADVDEDFISKIQPQSKAVIKLLADRSREYHGTVTRIYDRAIIKNNETYIPVEITIENINEHILPEMNADLKIATN